MKNTLKISAVGEDLISSMDDDTNRLFINDAEIPSSSWTGTGSYTATVEGHEITILKVEDTDGNIGIKRISEFNYQLYKHQSSDGADVTAEFIDEVEGQIPNIFDVIYPVGSIYMSVNATNPSALFGGAWVQIKDTFLLAAGDTYDAGDTGGEAEHLLTVDEMPSHTHFQQHQSDTSYVGIHVKNYNTGGAIQGVQPANGTRRNNIADPNTRVATLATGGDQAHNNLPPYLVVYVWKRTA